MQNQPCRIFEGFLHAHLVQYLGTAMRSEKVAGINNSCEPSTSLNKVQVEYPMFIVTSQELKDKFHIFSTLNKMLLEKLNTISQKSQGLIKKHGFLKVINHLKSQIYNNKTNCLAKTLLQYLRPISQELLHVYKLYIVYADDKKYLQEL